MENATPEQRFVVVVLSVGAIVLLLSLIYSLFFAPPPIKNELGWYAQCDQHLWSTGSLGSKHTHIIREMTESEWVEYCTTGNNE